MVNCSKNGFGQKYSTQINFASFNDKLVPLAESAGLTPENRVKKIYVTNFFFTIENESLWMFDFDECGFRRNTITFYRSSSKISKSYQRGQSGTRPSFSNYLFPILYSIDLNKTIFSLFIFCLTCSQKLCQAVIDKKEKKIVIRKEFENNSSA